MSGSRTDRAASRLAEQHLGDRLSALVDGELGHENRERVLAHVATCVKCKAEVDAQRRLKNVFAETAPPPPSESFLARLQGLPAGGDPGQGGPDPNGGPLPGRRPGLPGRSAGPGAFGVGGEAPFEFGYVPVGPHACEPGEPGGGAGGGGFRIHPVGRPDAERSALRGLRIAFVAAGAVSLAAVALGGVTSGAVGDTSTEGHGGAGTGSNVSPAAASAGAATGSEAARRRQQAGPPLARDGSFGAAPAAPTSLTVSQPSQLPGAPAAPAGSAQQAAGPQAAPTAGGAALLSPLIRSLAARPPITLPAGSADSATQAPGVLAAPLTAPAPTAPASRMLH
ncbi:zf-HC2 domain-containing protein [Streptomyces sp. NPDC046985]|uniref:anti-sigma factor family protein n=1 Tax=Streptomyces sp. NPDC046985 TaxID=3155377 RepID=UPI003411D7C6